MFPRQVVQVASRIAAPVRSSKEGRKSMRKSHLASPGHARRVAAMLAGEAASSVGAAAVGLASPGVAACSEAGSAARVKAGAKAPEPELYPKNEANAYGVLKDRPTLAVGSVEIPVVFHMISDHPNTRRRDGPLEHPDRGADRRPQRVVRGRDRGRARRIRRSGSSSPRRRGRSTARGTPSCPASLVWSAT